VQGHEGHRTALAIELVGIAHQAYRLQELLHQAHAFRFFPLVGQGGQGKARAQSRGGDDVVPAGVSDPGQGVVLADHCDQRPVAVAGPSLEGGLEAVGAALYGQSVVGQHPGQQVVGVVLLKAQLGPFMDAV